jgi:hypothetical protein
MTPALFVSLLANVTAHYDHRLRVIGPGML